MARSLIVTALDDVPDIAPGDDLGEIVIAALRASSVALIDGDIVALAQKIVSKAEGRQRALADVRPSQRARDLAVEVNKDPRLVELILGESRQVVRARRDVLIVEHQLGSIMANAGIDQSNIDHAPGEQALLLPENPDASCRRLRDALSARSSADVGVVIIDSIGRAWRNGTVGTAIGVAGIAALADLRGRPDRHGRPLRTSELGFGDEIAAAASLVMGQADEGTPIAHLRGAPRYGREGVAADLLRPKERDLFR